MTQYTQEKSDINIRKIKTDKSINFPSDVLWGSF